MRYTEFKLRKRAKGLASSPARLSFPQFLQMTQHEKSGERALPGPVPRSTFLSPPRVMPALPPPSVDKNGKPLSKNKQEIYKDSHPAHIPGVLPADLVGPLQYLPDRSLITECKARQMRLGLGDFFPPQATTDLVTKNLDELSKRHKVSLSRLRASNPSLPPGTKIKYKTEVVIPESDRLHIIRQYGFDPEQVDLPDAAWMDALAQKESLGGLKNANADSTARGRYQMLKKTFDSFRKANPGMYPEVTHANLSGQPVEVQTAIARQHMRDKTREWQYMHATPLSMEDVVTRWKFGDHFMSDRGFGYLKDIGGVVAGGERRLRVPYWLRYVKRDGAFGPWDKPEPARWARR